MLVRVEETLAADVLEKMHAPPKPSDVPVLSDPADLEKYDGFLLGIPTRYGNFPAQWKVCALLETPADISIHTRH